MVHEKKFTRTQLTCLQHTHFSKDFSVTWFWHSNLDCGLFCLLDAGYTELNSTWYGDMAYGRCDWSAEDAYSSMTYDPTFAFLGSPCCSALDFVFALWITITFYTVLTSCWISRHKLLAICGFFKGTKWLFLQITSI
jgi:hypothetical protein